MPSGLTSLFDCPHAPLASNRICSDSLRLTYGPAIQPSPLTSVLSFLDSLIHPVELHKSADEDPGVHEVVCP